jgi:hypothetical protein
MQEANGDGRLILWKLIDRGTISPRRDGRSPRERSGKDIDSKASWVKYVHSELAVKINSEFSQSSLCPQTMPLLVLCLGPAQE